MLLSSSQYFAQTKQGHSEAIIELKEEQKKTLQKKNDESIKMFRK